jgi:hypothetical protein
LLCGNQYEVEILLLSCVEADKLRLYKATPRQAAGYKEAHALLMRRKRFKVRPNQKRIQGWIEKYRERRKMRGQSVTTRPVAEVAKRYAQPIARCYTHHHEAPFTA